MYSVHLRHILCLMLMGGVGFESATWDTAKRHFTVADDIRLVHFGQEDPPVIFSPDGLYFAVETERGLLDQNRPESALRMYKTNDVQQFLLHPEAVGEPSPVWTFSKSTFKNGP